MAEFIAEAMGLFPAHAGVILSAPAVEELMATFPRTRGGDPYEQIMNGSGRNFSPHTRG